jgi:hypothetical protein
VNLQELVEKIRQEAIGIGGDPVNSPLLDTTTLIELVLPRVIDLVVANMVKDDQQIQELRVDSLQVFASGTSSLPSNVKDEYLPAAYVKEDTTASLEPQWWDYVNNGHPFFGSWHVVGSALHYRAGGQAALTFTGNLTFNFITTPVLPSSASATVVIRPSIIEQIITAAVAVIRGEIPLASIGLDYLEAKDAS